MQIIPIKTSEKLEISYGTGDSDFGLCFIAWTGQGICFLGFSDNTIRHCEEAEGRRRGNPDPSSAANLKMHKCLDPYVALRAPLDDGVLKNLWNKSTFKEEPAAARKLVTAIFKEKHRPNLIVTGTDFQIKVWETLLQINSGITMSYESFAKQVGGTNYTRAAASAIARNNISYLIPCHRVIHKSGNVNKYRWGSEVKTKLLNWEAAQLI